ncbi:hypothetical protein ACEN9F_22685 [Duganella sp. CT11-25]|uniref:hypothetical protein n=1 Tax=unclassified Duganella TaxID=2636909 RepID=UPI0039B0DD03
MKNVLSHRPVTISIDGAYTDMLAMHAQTISLLKDGTQQHVPVREDFQIQDEWEAITHPDYTLLVYPQDDIQFKSWLLPFDQQPFSPAQPNVIIYLHLPFDRDAEVELTMNDNVFWVTDDQVMAAARIEAVLYEDIVLKDQGIIVPVIVESFLHCRPFSFDSLRQYTKEMEILDDDEDIGEIKVAHEAPTQAVRCATTIPFEIGYAVLSYIDGQYRAQQEANQV